MHLVATEWYKIFSLTVPSTWIAFVLAAVITGIILYVKFGKEASSQFGDLVFVFIIVWKLSVVLTDFTTVIKYPLMILYFSGEKSWSLYWNNFDHILFAVSPSATKTISIK